MNANKLEIFPWNDNFATGIEEIDHQHQKLVELLNVLVSHLAFNADTPALNKIFDELKNYTVVHFSSEERIWHQHFKDDPWEAWHKEAHTDFIAQVLEIKQRETQLPMDDVIAEIVTFLTHWLALHIIESDKRMAKVVLALPSGISLERAKEQANEEMAGSTRILINTVMGMYDKLANRTVELTREISRRSKAEAELRATQEDLLRLKNAAVAANQAMSAVLANMGQEIRTPTSALIDMTELLLNTALTPEQLKMVHSMQESAQAQLGILNDILGGSIDQGRLGPVAEDHETHQQQLIRQQLSSPVLAERSSLSIMLLDDDPFMHELMGFMLEEMGQSDVSCYETGETALAALDGLDKQPDLILLDINMPGMDGIEVMQQLALRHYPGCLVMFSGEDELMLRTTEQFARERRLFVLGSVQKPPQPQRLAELLRQCEHRDGAAATSAVKRTPIQYDAAMVRAAIDRGEFINYYQPKVTLPGGEWIGVESLVRWSHPQNGLVFPDQFIPVAEAGGIINDLTRHVLQLAIRQARAWRDAGLDLRVAVNVSMDDLTDVSFADFAIEQVQRHNVPPQSIILEITEGRLMQDYATALHVLSRLRLKRFRLSIDDFGTGHSSLVQLRDLPFDELKIDRGFAHNAWQDDRLRAIFEGSLEMAKQLHMEVVAEGIEDQQDWDFLKTTSCDLVQGYFVARPMPAAELPSWHHQWSQRMLTGHE